MERGQPSTYGCLFLRREDDMEIESKRRATVFFVDDHRDVQEIVACTLQDIDVDVVCLSSAKECLKLFPSQPCDLLLTDVRMPGVDGFELLGEIKKMAPMLPTIVVSGYANVKMAVQAMKAGAIDFIEKPLSRNALQTIVRAALSKVSQDDRSIVSIAPLTAIEREVLRLLLEGKSNQEIADIRHRSKRTVEDERKNIMKKLGATNIIDLVRITSATGLFDPQ